MEQITNKNQSEKQSEERRAGFPGSLVYNNHHHPWKALAENKSDHLMKINLNLENI